MNRRKFARDCLGVAAVLADGPAGTATRCASAEQRKIMLILVDDLGYGDLGCYGRRSRKALIFNPGSENAVQHHSYGNGSQ